jgi:hypothetical protein
VNRQEYKRTQAIVQSHPDWSDQLVAESAQLSEEDVAAVRLAVETGPPREQQPAS